MSSGCMTISKERERRTHQGSCVGLLEEAPDAQAPDGDAEQDRGILVTGRT